MDNADRISFAARRGVSRNALVKGQRLEAAKTKKTRVWLMMLFRIAIVLIIVIDPHEVVEAFLAFRGPFNGWGLVLCAFTLALLLKLSSRTQPFRGYVDRRGLVIEVRGTETLLAWDEFIARQVLPRQLILQMKRSDALPRIFGLRVRHATWLPLAKSLFASDGDWQQALDLTRQELDGRAADVLAAPIASAAPATPGTTFS